MDVFLRTDELKEAVFALKEYRKRARRARKDNYEWKWAIVAMHNAVQGFMVCALGGTSCLSVLDDKTAKKLVEAYRQGKNFPREKMDTYMQLYQKIQSTMMCQLGGDEKFSPSGSQSESMVKLNYFRNKFIHYLPCVWSLDVRILPSICGDTLDVIYFLNNSINMNFGGSGEDISREKVNRVIQGSFRELFELSMEYEAG